MIYLLDTNAISDLIDHHIILRMSVNQAKKQGHTLGICQPIYFELLRGLFWKLSLRKLTILRDDLLPLFTWFVIEDTDWFQAAQFWADARRNGKQIDDVDVLLSAMAHRLNATIVSADNDFVPLPIKRED